MVTLTIDEAQKDLPALAKRALSGEQVFIRVEGTHQLLSLHGLASELPPNFLAECYGPQEIAEENYLAEFGPKGTTT
jgi:hypothetical protein